ncbi:MAG: hypothetical protein MJ160_01645 [Treponema sp.]|nr:hypothetical protein [Treponema sp.]
MGKEDLPFTFYDFLGYFVPGFFFLSSLSFIFDVKNIQVIIPTIPENLAFIDYIALAIFSYIVGHILSYLSSMTVELYSIWSLGYPSRYLLNLEFKGFWYNFLKSRKKTLKSFTLFIKEIVRMFLLIFLIPIIITDLFFRKLCSTRRLLGKPLDRFTQSIVAVHILKFFNIFFPRDKIYKQFYKNEKDDTKKRDLKIGDFGNDFFNIIYHFVLENAPNHISKIQNFVTLYGFTRTLCFTLICIFWIIIINGFGGTFSWSITILLLSLFIIISFLYLAFNKFYRKFSAEVYYAFVTIQFEDKNHCKVLDKTIDDPNIEQRNSNDKPTTTRRTKRPPYNLKK